MKILVSAPACNPYQGSEGGVGWTAVCLIASKHEVFVLVDAISEHDWKKAKSEGLVPTNVQVRFLGKPKKYVENRFIAKIQSWLWYVNFNRLVLNAAQQWHHEENFHLCHQITIATWRVASPLWKLPIPFIWGPLGGTGRIPDNFRSMLSLKARLFELMRDLSTAISIRSKAFKKCVENSTFVIAANEETMNFLRPYRGAKPLIQLPIVSLSPEKINAFKRELTKVDASRPLQIFAGGFMIGSKGVSLALKALSKVKSAGIDFHYTIAGSGPEIESLKELTRNLGIKEQVTFHEGFSGNDYINALQKSDVYLLPSFREGTPVTLIEACLAGCYPVVADISAQGEIVRSSYGIAIPVTNMDQLVQDISESVIWCANNREKVNSYSEPISNKIASLFSSGNYEKSLFDVYEILTSKS